jgi:hypothetical protein
LHEEVDIAPDGENGNDHAYGTNDEPESDTRPARNKEAIKKKRSKKSKKRSKNCKRKHSSSDDSDSSSSSSLSSSSSSSSNSDTDSDSAYYRKNKSKKKFKVKLASKHIPNLNDKRPAKERHDKLVELNKPLHRALRHAESNLNNVQKVGAPHKTAKKVVAEIQGVLRVLEKQSNHLFFGATYGWDKLGNALINHSHLPSSTKKFAKKLSVKAGDASKAPVPFLPKRRPPFTTQTLNHSLPQQHYNAPLHPAPTFQQSFPMPPPAPPPYVNGHAGGNRSGPPNTSGAHTHCHNRIAANGFRRPGYNGYNNFNGTPR